MLPLENLIGNFRLNIPLGRYGYLKVEHGCLPMASNSRLMAPCFRAGRDLEFFFRKNLISRHLSFLERSPLSFWLSFTPFWLVPTTV
jgi:hypothetical protein